MQIAAFISKNILKEKDVHIVLLLPTNFLFTSPYFFSFPGSKSKIVTKLEVELLQGKVVNSARRCCGFVLYASTNVCQFIDGGLAWLMMEGW